MRDKRAADLPKHILSQFRHKLNKRSLELAHRKTKTRSGTGNKNTNRKRKSGEYKNRKRKADKMNNRKRKRRHVGPHDENGLQRLLSTGSLAPTTLSKDHPKYNHSIDFVFATYWFFPAKTRAILPADQKCIEKKMAQETIRFDPKSK